MNWLLLSPALGKNWWIDTCMYVRAWFKYSIDIIWINYHTPPLHRGQRQHRYDSHRDRQSLVVSRCSRSHIVHEQNSMLWKQTVMCVLWNCRPWNTTFPLIYQWYWRYTQKIPEHSLYGANLCKTFLFQRNTKLPYFYLTLITKKSLNINYIPGNT